MTHHCFFGPKLIELQRDWLWHVLITFLSFEKGHVTSFEERSCTAELAIWHSGSRTKNNICSLFIVVCPGRPFMVSSCPLFSLPSQWEIVHQMCAGRLYIFYYCVFAHCLDKGRILAVSNRKKRFTFSFTCDNIWWKRGALFIDMQINSSKVLCKLTLQLAL